jgi:hypothetical protein
MLKKRTLRFVLISIKPGMMIPQFKPTYVDAIYAIISPREEAYIVGDMSKIIRTYSSFTSDSVP